VARRVRALAQEVAQGRLLVLGGGGYDLDNVSKGWATVVEGLLSS
jgi:acetoin utilization protein AcuC